MYLSTQKWFLNINQVTFWNLPLYYNSALSEDAFAKLSKTMSVELYVGRGSFDVELAPLNKLIIIVIIIILDLCRPIFQ